MKKNKDMGLLMNNRESIHPLAEGLHAIDLQSTLTFVFKTAVFAGKSGADT